MWLCTRCTTSLTTFPAFSRQNWRFTSVAVRRRQQSHVAATTSSLPLSPAKSRLVSRVEHSFFDLIKRYENFIGITAVKNAQDNCVEMERLFVEAQDARRVKQDELKNVQMRLKEIHAELDKTSRGEDRYLHLLTEEHQQIKEERRIVLELQSLEKNERIKFQSLSSYLREGHEKERERAERTKYFSIIGSIAGALIGIIGATLTNRFRMREMRNIVTTSSDPAKVKTVLHDLNAVITQQQQQVRAFMTDVRAMMAGQAVVGANATAASNEPTIENDQQIIVAGSSIASTDRSTSTVSKSSTINANVILDAIRTQEQRLESEMQDIKRIVAAEHGYKPDEKDGDTLIYIGTPEMSSMLAQTAADLEAKMKMQTLVAVVAVYAALVLTIPVLFALSR